MKISLIAVLALAALAGCSGENRQPAVDPRIADESRPLLFLANPTEPPCTYRNEKGEIVGTDIDFARQIAERMGRELVMEAVDFIDILPRLKEGTADFSIATITMTEARQRDVDFSEPYGEGGARFLYRTAGKKPRMSQLNAIRIGIESDSAHDIYLCLHGCDPKRYLRIQDAVAALKRGEIDAVLFDGMQLATLAEASGGELAVSSQETREFYGVAVDKRRPDILAAANAVIAERRAK